MAHFVAPVAQRLQPARFDADNVGSFIARFNGLAIFMKKLALAALGLTASVVCASAADLAARPYTKAPVPVVAPIHNWGGFYVGVNGGGGAAHQCWTETGVGSIFGFVNRNNAPSEGCHNATGGTVGGQIGYRWQASNWVFGVEAQGNWANFNGANFNVDPLAAGRVNT
jgi:outer membrane immunogenic protein